MVKYVNSLSNFIKTKVTGYNTVIINFDKSKRTHPDIIGGNSLCIHSNVKNQICTKCNAFVGFIGYEDNAIRSYTHVNFVCSNIDADFIYVIHSKVIPIDYKQFSSIMKYTVKYHRSVVFTKDSIINVYSKEKIKDTYRHYSNSYFHFLISLRNIGNVFWINPNEAEAQLKSDFLIFKENK